MKIYYQQNEKDCMTCVVAMLLDLDINNVPDFYESECQEVKDGWNKENAFDVWLSKRNLMRIVFDVEVQNGVIKKIPFASAAPIRCIGTLYKPGNDVSHAVVIEVDKKEIHLLHDPMPNSIYELTDIIQIELIVGLNEQICCLAKDNNLP